MRRMYFEDVLVEMFARFVHTATSAQAYEQYDAVTYHASEGVQAFYDELMDAADLLTQCPNEVEMSTKFLMKMPESIYNYLVRMHGVTADGTRLTHLLELALRHERAAHQDRHIREARAREREGKQPRERADVDNRRREDRDDRRERQERDERRGRDGSRERYERNRQYPRERSRSRPRFIIPLTTRVEAERPPRVTVTATAEAKPRPSTPVLARPATPAARDANCFNCNRYGHFARDCPEPSRERLNALHDEENQEESADTEDATQEERESGDDVDEYYAGAYDTYDYGDESDNDDAPGERLSAMRISEPQRDPEDRAFRSGLYRV
jgi:hypothetical protein